MKFNEEWAQKLRIEPVPLRILIILEQNLKSFVGRRLLLLSTVYLYSHALGDYMLSLVIEIILSNIFAWPYLNAPLVMNIFPYLLSYVFLSTVALLYRIYIDW